MVEVSRRSFLLAASAAIVRAQASGRFIKCICSVVFPADMPLPEAMRRAKDAGFQAFEIQMNKQLTPDTTPEELSRIRDGAHSTGLMIAAIWPSGFIRNNPLNSPDPAVRAKGVHAIEKALEFAVELQCEELLIVPGRVSLDGNEKRARAGYQESWDRTTAELKQLVPLAEKAKVSLGIENVVNKFLLSPMEMCTYVDQFHSPWVRSHFDVGNTMPFGYPQDWIAILGKRIKRVHLKDYKAGKQGGGSYVPLTEGDVNWKEVMAAFVKADYRGTLSPEIGHNPNDPDQLIKISRSVDKILALA
jgi:L-ribulose-5-phosphate 3-epimerase